MKLPRGIPLDRNGTVTPKGTPRESVPLRNKVAHLALLELNLRVCTNPHHRQVLSGNISDRDNTNAIQSILLQFQEE